MASNRISVLFALEGTDDNLRAALQRADEGLDELGRHARTAGERASASVAQVKAGVGAFTDQVQRLKVQVLAVLGVFEFGRRIQQLLELADAWNQMEGRLKLATAGSREFTVAQDELFAIAQRIGTRIGELADLYAKLQGTMRQLGGTQRQSLQLTEAIAQALRLSNATTAQSEAVLLQFGQALAAGVLRGEEFNSVVENSPRLAQALADGLNVPIGRLRKLAEQGQLTADIVVQALLSQKDRLAAEYAQLPPAIAQAFTRLTNAIGKWAHEVDQSTGITRKLAEVLDWVARNIDTIMRWLGRLIELGLGVLAYRAIPAVIAAFQTVGAAGVAAATTTTAAWAAANQTLGAAVGQIGLVRTAFAVMAAAWAGWEIGTWLSERFAIVRKAGIYMVEVLQHGIEELRYSWERFSALFTSDTLDAATKRHQDRLAELDRIFGEMYADAEKSQKETQQAMDQAAAAAEETAKRLDAVRKGTQEAVGRGAEALNGAIAKLDGQIATIETRATQARQAVQTHLAQIAESTNALTALVQAALARKLELEKQHYVAALATLTAGEASQREQITKTADLQAALLTRQTQAQRDATAETLRLIDQEATTRKATAEREHQDVTQVEVAILATKRQHLGEALTAYRQHVDALNTEANRHLAEIRRIEDEKRALTQTTEERIRELRRSTLTATEQYQDRLAQVSELQAKSRAALAEGEFEQAKRYAQQAADLAAQSAQAVRDGDKEVVSQKQAVQRAIDAIRESEKLTAEALQGEANAHRDAANAAVAARDRINATLKETQSQLDTITAQLKDKLTLSIAVDTRQVQTALDDLDKALAEKERLVPIKADLQEAERQLTTFGDKVKAGETMVVKADTASAQASLDKLSAYAQEHSLAELKLNTDKAQTALQNVDRQVRALSAIETESKHQIRSNIEAARADVMSLDGVQTSSTHTIYVKRVEQNAVGGLVGVAKFASGGRVGFPTMRGGKVPGSGHHDTIPRTLDAGSFVLRKAAVRHYGDSVLGRASRGLMAFASGGPVSPVLRKKNKAVDETFKLMEFGRQGLDFYADETERTHPLGTELGFRQRTLAALDKSGANDRAFLETILYRKTLTGAEQEHLAKIQTRWRNAMAQALLYGRDYERDLVEWSEQQDPTRYYAAGGSAVAASDTVPALLTPGEYVVNRDVVSRFGVGFFDALNRMAFPKEALANRVRGYATGGLVDTARRIPQRIAAFADSGGADLAERVAANLARELPRPKAPNLPVGAEPSKTIRVELTSGASRVSASLDARDETRLLALLKQAQSRSQ